MENSTSHLMTVQDDIVVSLDYILTVDGGVIDRSAMEDPITFIQGHGQIVPGLERQLYGMSIGESKKVIVIASEGYGEIDPDAFADVPRSQFPSDIPLEAGVQLQLRDQDGQVLDAFIDDVDHESVRLSFNHPLAGKDLHFAVKVAGLRDATDEELAHGHVHDSDYEEEEDQVGEDWPEEDLE